MLFSLNLRVWTLYLAKIFSAAIAGSHAAHSTLTLLPESRVVESRRSEGLSLCSRLGTRSLAAKALDLGSPSWMGWEQEVLAMIKMRRARS